MYNNLRSVLSRLQKGISKLSDADVRSIILNHEERIKHLEMINEASSTSGSDPVAGAEDPKPGAGKRGRPRKSDAPSSEKAGDA